MFMVQRRQLRGCFSARSVEEDFILNAIDVFHRDNLNSMQVNYSTSLG